MLRSILIKYYRGLIALFLSLLVGYNALAGVPPKTSRLNAANVVVAPTITFSKPELSGFTATLGKNSIAQKYTMFWKDMPGGKDIELFFPAGFEGNTSGPTGEFKTFAIISAAFIARNSSQEVFVRLKDNILPGSHKGVVQHTFITSPSTSMANFPVSGTVFSLPAKVAMTQLGTTSPTQTDGPPSYFEGESPRADSAAVRADNLLSTGSQKVFINFPESFEVSLNRTFGFSHSLVIAPPTPGQVVSYSKKIYFRLKPNLKTGNYIEDATFFNDQVGTATVLLQGGVGKIKATMGVSPDNITGLTAIKATGKPSEPKNYLFTASDFPTNDCQIINSFTIIAPKNFEVSAKKEGPYQEVFTIGTDADDVSGQVNLNNLQTSLFVRLKGDLAVGDYAGDVLHVHPLTGVRKLSVSGSVKADIEPKLVLSITSATNLTAVKNQPSFPRGYRTFLKEVTPNTAFTITSTAPAGFEVSNLQKGTFGSTASITLTTDNLGNAEGALFVRLKASSTAKTVTGFVQHEVVGTTLNAFLNVKGTIATSIATAAPTNKNQVLAGLNAYPVPVQDQLTVAFEAPARQEVQIRLLDLQGNTQLKHHLVAPGGNQQIKLSLTGQKAGLYILEVITGTERQTVEIIKK
ncbi:T9SS type A sorting domain-containing protein [Adhaeribacter arboris]|nr:T9SS type A sorting domain-containing protein [Adhaeribacter arboris]